MDDDFLTTVEAHAHHVLDYLGHERKLFGASPSPGALRERGRSAAGQPVGVG
jgi:hypothetical protein